MKSTLLISLIVALVFGAGGFFGGIKYQQSKTPSPGARFADFQNGRAFRGGPGAGSANGRAGLGNMTAGEVLSKDDKSLTLKLRDGGSKIVFYATSTQVRTMADATMDAVAVGTPVSIVGTANSDGSVTAQQIQIRPSTP